MYAIVLITCPACGITDTQNNRILYARLSFTGDIMLHGLQAEAAFDKKTGAYDFNPPFQAIRKYFTGSDLVIGNLETTFANFYSDYPLFSAPDAFAAALGDAGFGLLCTVNNHCFDYGYDGLVRTLDVLNQTGIGHAGTNRTREERDCPDITTINGIEFIFLAYTYGTNAYVPDDYAYSVNLLDENLINRQITDAITREPDFIVVLAHMGDEYALEPSAQTVYWAEFMLNCGADIVVACHPHAVQRVEIKENGGVIAYSTGNFISTQRTPPCDYGMILNMEFTKTNAGRASLSEISFIPTWVKLYDGQGLYDIRVLPVGDAMDGFLTGNAYKIKRQDYGRLYDINDEITKNLMGSSHTAQTEYVIYKK